MSATPPATIADKNPGAGSFPASPTPNPSQVASPSAKRAINFDYWAKGKKDGGTDAKKAKMDNSGPIPIAELTTGKYGITGRITLKRYFGGVTEGGSYSGINLNIIDKSSEISVVGFPNEAKRFGDLVEVNKCYLISNFYVEEESEKYPTYTGHRYQVKLNRYSKIEPMPDVDIPKIPFKLMSLENLNAFEDNQLIDVIGIVVQNCGLSRSANANGNPLMYRNIVITDQTKQCVRVTLWNEKAENFGDDEKISVVFRNARVGTFQSRKCLSAGNCCQEWKNPDVPERQDLEEWFKKADNEQEEISDDENNN